MPVTLFACPPDKPTHGQAHDPEHCVTKCTHQCYSPFLLTALYGTNQRNHHKGRYVSATALPGCKRRLKNERQVDYAEYPQNLYASFRGTITHEVIEQAMETKFKSGRTLTDLGFVAEWRMLTGFCLTPGHGAFSVDPDLDIEDTATYAQTTCPKCDSGGVHYLDQKWIFLGGTLDGGAPVFDWDAEMYGTILIVDGVAHYKLSDIKTMKEFALSYFIKGDPKNTLHPQIKDDYVWQARVYTYLAKHARVPQHLADRGVESIQMVRSDIQAFAMGEAPWTGGGTFRWRDHHKNPLKDWPMHPIDLGTDAEVEAYILANAPAILDTLVLNTHRGDVRRPDQAWLCEDYCAFYGTDICPNPQLESDLIEDGMDKDEAFAFVQNHPVEPVKKPVSPLDEFDTQNIDNFFRKQRGEATAEKLVKPRKPRAKKAS